MYMYIIYLRSGSRRTVTQRRRPSLIDLHAPMVANRLNHAGQSPCYSGP